MALIGSAPQEDLYDTFSRLLNELAELRRENHELRKDRDHHRNEAIRYRMKEAA
jgi:hypothetical protein